MIIIFILFTIIIILLLNKITNTDPFSLNDKQITFNKCLTDMKQILNKNKIHFFLYAGTLLGQYRENKFLDHDNDIDIGILRNNYDPTIKSKIIDSNLFKFRHEFGKLEESYECTFIHKETNISIDIFIFYKIPNKKKYYYSSSHTRQCNNTKEGYCKWGRYIRGFKQIKFNKNIYNIPKNTNEFLINLYGKDWRIPKKFNYYEGLISGYNKIN